MISLFSIVSDSIKKFNFNNNPYVIKTNSNRATI